MQKPKTHKKVAVAIDTGENQKGPPKVSATAVGLLAKKIIEIAKENEVPIVEDEELAENLKLLELGSTLPEELFPVIAEIIAHIHEIAATHRSFPVAPKKS